MASNESSVPIISLPKGGGALSGLGEKFSPDLHTGTGNFTIPIALPPGRGGFQPSLNLLYSTGTGNGHYGLGWNLSLPGMTRKTSKGIPRFRDAARQPKDRDTFLLSGAEDLVELGPFTDEVGVDAVRYRPRTEGLFAEILRYRDVSGTDYWRVRTKDGLVSYYGTNPTAGEHPQYPPPAPTARDPAASTRPDQAEDIFRWNLTLTKDPFGNRIEYLYGTDGGTEYGRTWHQPLLHCIRYADYGPRATPSFLVNVTFEYEDRPDAFSEYRSGFEIRTSKRCKAIHIETHADADHKVRRYEFEYQQGELNDVSLLTRVHVVGFDDDGVEARELPPLDFGYSNFQPGDQTRRDFFPLTGELPASSLANPNLDLVDLFGHALPDILELNGTARYWRNLGGGRFDTPRPMVDAPAGLALADAGVQLVDANGDGSVDLMISQPVLSGYFPLRFGATWDRRSLQCYRAAPSFDLEDPEVRLLDLTGDGVTDALRSAARFECYFNDADEGWHETRFVERAAPEEFPNVSFSDPRVKLSDMSGDGLIDIVLVHDRNVEYWPNCGHGTWGARVTMHNAPRLPFDYDPRRLLVGDVDGDGLADIAYVDDGKVHLWINRSGNGWSDEIVIAGTPGTSDADAVRITDLLGSGVGGVLWSRDARTDADSRYFFLDLTGGAKPYLLTEMNNNMGALTRVTFVPSTTFSLRDDQQRDTRWATPLPMPAQVVARVEVVDELSRGKLTTEYRYRNGYRDGLEGEFRGFGLVEQLDSESFATYAAADSVDEEHFSPPTLTRTWFHQGAIDDEGGGFSEHYPEHEFWVGDAHQLNHPGRVQASLFALALRYATRPARERRRVERDALRALRGNVLRTELYALDGSPRELRPYLVNEFAYDVREEAPPAPSDTSRRCIFFPHLTAQRTTEWERGDDPRTRFTFSGGYDAFGQLTSQSFVAMPRRSATRLPLADDSRILATHTRTRYATPQKYVYNHSRLAVATSFTLRTPSGVAESNASDLAAVLRDQSSAARSVHEKFETDLADWVPADGDSAGLRIYAHTVNHYDGAAFVGRAPGDAGRYGALTRAESLVLTDEILADAYGAASLVTAPGRLARTNGVPATFADDLGYSRLSGPDHVDGLYVTGTQQQFDFQLGVGVTPRGLAVAARDPLGNQTDIAFDTFGLVPIAVTDAIGLETRATYNYRLVQPSLITDPNGNRQQVDYLPSGMVSAIWMLGKSGRNEGDRTRPCMRLDYDLRAFFDSKRADPLDPQPARVRTIRQVYHDTDPDDDGTTIESTDYSDGFGRLLQTRAQGEALRYGDADFGGGDEVLPGAQDDPGPAAIAGRSNTSGANPNVVVSAWQRYDNKGRVIEKYEPHFATGWQFARPTAAQLGHKAVMFYDPRGRIVRTINPDGSEERVVFGTPATLDAPDDRDRIIPSPWVSFTYDANDNAGRTHGAVAVGYRHHWNTPSSTLTDALGRQVMVVERTRDAATSAAAPLPPVQELRTRTVYDIQDNVLSVRDALGRVALTHVYDLARRAVRTDNIDAGRVMVVLDGAGNQIERRDDKGALSLRSYDQVNRPVAVRARNVAAESLTLRERLVYGDDSDRNQAAASRAANRARNLLGALARYFDEAGVLACEAYDFAGRLLDKERRVFTDQTVLTGLATLPGRSIDVFTVDWESDPQLDGANPYRTTTSFDALSRVKQITFPQDVDGSRRVLAPRFNAGGGLEQVTIDGEVCVSHIAYNAKGQRVFIAYGNERMTRYAYDDLTFQVRRVCTHRFTQTGQTYQPQGQPLQDSAYRYDLARNLLELRDQVRGCGVQGSAEGSDVLTRTFAYDPLYRLTRATGRESDNGTAPRAWGDVARRGFNSGNHATPTQDNAPTLTQRYWEDYSYDPVGNMLAMRHGAGSAGPVAWTRRFGMGDFEPQDWETNLAQWRAGAPTDWGSSGNRLTNLGGADQATTHRFDAVGNLVQELTNRHFAWDFADRLVAFADRPAGAAAATKDAVYLHDARGLRIKSIVRWGAAVRETTVSIDGLFEHHRRIKPGDDRENNTLHVMDDQRRLAVLRVGTAFPDDGGPRVRYHLADNVGSSVIALGGDDFTASGFVNREEFYPYGETSFGSFARKRYRFMGKVRDAESGLSYHGARYYAPWMCRWISCDPAGPRDSMQLYCFVRGNPAVLIDPSGGSAALSDSFWTGMRNRAVETLSGLATTVALNVATGGAYGMHQMAASMSAAYKEGGGGGWGVLNAVNTLNPVNTLLTQGWLANEEAGQALYLESLGDMDGARAHAQKSGSAMTDYTVGAVELGATVAGGLKLSRKLGVPGTYQPPAATPPVAKPPVSAPKSAGPSLKDRTKMHNDGADKLAGEMKKLGLDAEHAGNKTIKGANGKSVKGTQGTATTRKPDVVTDTDAATKKTGIEIKTSDSPDTRQKAGDQLANEASFEGKGFWEGKPWTIGEGSGVAYTPYGILNIFSANLNKN